MNQRSSADLAALVGHPAWSGVTYLGEAPSAPVSVERTALVRDVRSPLPGAGTLVTVLYSADRDDWHLDNLLSRARAHGVAALLLEGLEPLRRSTRTLAARFRLPVLGSPDPLASHRAVEELLTAPELVQARAVLRSLRATRTAGGGVDGVVGALGAALGRPTALLDSLGAPLSGDLGDLAPRAAAAVARASRQDWTARSMVVDGYHLVVCPVHAAGTSAWLVSLLPEPLPVEVTAHEGALSAVAPVLEQRLAVVWLELERDARQRAALLTDILRGSVTDAIRRRALDLGWPLEGWHTGVHVAVPGEPRPGHRLDVLAALTDAGAGDPVVVEHGDGYAAWVTTDYELTARHIQRLADTLRRAQQRLGAELSTSMGVGRVHGGPAGLVRSLLEAEDAARLARGRPHTGRFVHVDRLGLDQLLLAWTRTDTFQPAARALLEPLHGQPGDLVTTLLAYLDHESSVADTAAVLGVHRNTVAARVQRIERVLAVDLSDPESRLALHLAVRAL